MCCLRDQLQEVVDAGHPDTAMIAITIGAARELLTTWAANIIVLPGSAPVTVGLDLATRPDMQATL